MNEIEICGISNKLLNKEILELVECPERKHIEEMYQEFLDYKEATSCEVFSYRGMCENFINLGYTKIDYKNIDNIDLMIFKGRRFVAVPEGSVVLTIEEVDEFRKDSAEVKFLKNKIIEQARKETAKEILQALLDFVNCEKINQGHSFEKIKETLIKVAKTYEVEVEE